MGLALLAAACSDDYTDWANPQSNEEEEVKTVSLTVEEIAPIDYAALDGDAVQLFQASIASADSTENTYEVVLYDANKTETDTLEANGNCEVSVEALKESVWKLYGRRPVQREIPLKVIGYHSVNGQAVKSVGETTAKVTLTAPFIDEAYYFYGTNNNFSTTDQTYELDNGGGDVYDNSVFSITIPAPKDNDGSRVDFYFRIAPATAYSSTGIDESNVIAATDPNATDALSGSFSKTGGEAFHQPASDGAKYYKLEFDMWNSTYTITPTSDPELFLTGDKYGWGGTWKPLTMVNGNTEMFWTIIYLKADELFKFAPQAGWGNDFGPEATVNDVAGAGITADGGNLKATNAGWYLLKVTNGSVRKVEVLNPEIYLYGESIGSWNDAPTDPNHKFSIPTDADGEFVSPEFVNDAEVRMFVDLEDGNDWWRTEFIVNAQGKIDFRGNGGDQTRVNVKKGQRAYLNFTDGTGEYK